MNIFILSWLVEECAAWHFDSHVCKMIVELAQLLSTAHWSLLEVVPDASEHDRLKERLLAWQAVVPRLFYKSTHCNHPCAIWVRKHVNNYRYTARLAKQLCIKYYETFGVRKNNRRHASEAVIDHLLENEPPCWPALAELLLPPMMVTEPAQAMPEQYRVAGDAVAAYRAYYQSPEKLPLATWSAPRSTPPWWCGPTIERLKIAGVKRDAKEIDAAEI